MRKYVSPIPGKFYRFVDGYTTAYTLGSWRFIAKEGDVYRFHLIFSGSDEIDAVDDDVIIDDLQYSYMLPDPAADEANEVADRIRNATEWDPDDCRHLCELAGMSEEWEDADGDTFESVIYAAADALNVKL